MLVNLTPELFIYKGLLLLQMTTLNTATSPPTVQFFFSIRPPLGLLPVLGPLALGSHAMPCTNICKISPHLTHDTNT